MSKSSHHPEIDKVALILLSDSKILTARSSGKDKFYIPGGKRNPGESDLQCLSRETMEELSVSLDTASIHYMGTFKAQANGKPSGVLVKMTCYYARHLGTLKPASEIAEIRWLAHKDKNFVSYVDLLIFDYLKKEGLLK